MVALRSAMVTGAFCAGFTVVVSWVTPMLDLAPLAALSALSGFLGSLFARLVLGKPIEKE